MMRINEKRRDSRDGPADWFTGDVWIDAIAPAPSRLRVHSVHFSPGARTAWHRHPVGQILHVTEGAGRVQRRDAAAETILVGDTVQVEPGEWHWHGAGPDTFMTRLAIQEAAPDGTEAEWSDHVGDADYLGDQR